MPRFLQLERKHGSITRAIHEMVRGQKSGPKAAFCSLSGGLGRLVERLASRLDPRCIQLDCPVDELEPASSGRWTLRGGGRVLNAGSVILACPAEASARLLLRHDRRLAGSLEFLDHAPCATINLVYRRDAVRRSLNGFGFFVPAIEGLSVLACSYVNLKFPDRAPADRLLVRVFVGGARQPYVLEHDDAGLARLAHRTLVGLLRIEGEPLFQRIARFPRAMPQYPVGYRTTAQEIDRRQRRHPGLLLTGAVIGAFGLPDCVAAGESSALQALEHVLSSTVRPVSTAAS